MTHDAGGKSKFALKEGVTGKAMITEDGVHRIWLSRIWGPPPVKYYLFIGCNPSEAAGDVDDPTVIREVNFSRRDGMSGYFKVNAATYRCTDPKRLLLPGVKLAHDHNLTTILKLARPAEKVVMATGALHPRIQPLADQIVSALRAESIELWALGFTKDGRPRHPLYLKSDSKLVRLP